MSVHRQVLVSVHRQAPCLYTGRLHVCIQAGSSSCTQTDSMSVHRKAPVSVHRHAPVSGCANMAAYFATFQVYLSVVYARKAQGSTLLERHKNYTIG